MASQAIVGFEDSISIVDDSDLPVAHYSVEYIIDMEIALKKIRDMDSGYHMGYDHGWACDMCPTAKEIADRALEVR